MIMRRIFSFLLIGLVACVDPFDADIDDSSQLLTVDGYITTEPGPHLIRLSRSDRYGSVFDGLVVPILRATVIVRSSDGETTFLQEGERGRYFTPEGFRAEVGKSYSLLIELSDGTSYTSLPEAVLPVAPIDSLTITSVNIPSFNPLLDITGIRIFSHFKDPEDEANFYQWRTVEGTYVLISNPELVRDEFGDPDIPDCCDRCFFTEVPSPGIISVTDDVDFNGLNARVPVAFIEDDGRRFREVYRLDFQQLSLTATAHQFLRLVQQQISISGSVFDPPPANIRSNIVNVNDPTERVLGYFFAADAYTERIYIRRDQVARTRPDAIIPNDCREAGGFIGIPDDWNPAGN